MSTPSTPLEIACRRRGIRRLPVEISATYFDAAPGHATFGERACLQYPGLITAAAVKLRHEYSSMYLTQDQRRPLFDLGTGLFTS